MALSNILVMLEKNAPGVSLKLGITIVTACLAALLTPVPLLMAWVIFQAFLLEPVASFPLVPCFVAILSVATAAVFRVLSSRYSHEAAFTIGRGLRLSILNTLGNTPLHWFATQSSGALKKVLTTDINEVEQFIAHNIADTIAALLLPLVSIIFLLFVDWRMALILLFLLALACAIQSRSFKTMSTNKFMEKYVAALTMLHTDATEFVEGMPVIKIFNRAAESFDKMQVAIGQMKEMQQQVLSVYAVQWSWYAAVVAMPFTALAAAGLFFYLDGSLPLENLALFLMLGGVALVPLIRLMRFVAFVIRARQGWQAVRALLALPSEQCGQRTRAEVKSPDLRVENISVSYDGQTVLRDVSFTASAGTITAIVGPSGAGKSSLVAVLAGMEKPETGRVTVDGIPLDGFGPSERAATFSMVFQDPFIFSGTVAENIRLGSEQATDEQVREVARTVCCEDLIMSLPGGYETRIGAGGIRLSGGQRQRIALARAALRNAPIVLLDEATAFADPESEVAIQRGLAGYLAGKTVLIVAHRLSSIAGADAILVMEDGKIAETGRHDELLAANGVYTRLWEAHNTARGWAITTTQKGFLPEERVGI